MATGRSVPAKMVVTSRRDVAQDVVEIALEPEDGTRCPAWDPGAHVDVVLPSGVVRQYSICSGEPGRTLRIAVLRERQGRGGSVELHEVAQPGALVEIQGPRNHFRLVDAESYVFVAGGIGITPILAMIEEVVSRNAEWSLVYGGRTRRSMAFLPEVARLAERSGGAVRQLRVAPQDEAGLIDVAGVFSLGGPDAPVYACGPEPLLAALEEQAAGTGNSSRLHLERFGAGGQVQDAPSDGALGTFEVELASTGVVLTVGPEDRLIDVVRTQVPGLPFSCEEGYCGSCETGVLAGTPCHRDQVLGPEDREANDVMMICVGRALSQRLTLDL